MIYVAEVVERDPVRGGVRVRFRDLVRSGFAAEDFVRVLRPRMHTTGGAASWLPEKGELGAVGEVFGGHFLWLGSLPFLDANQLDPTDGIAYLRHESGVVVQIRPTGEFEISHPSGMRFTIGKAQGALPALQATSSPTVGDTTPPVVELAHPSGASIEIDADGNGKLHGFASLAFQDGSKRFCMEDLITWIEGHVHTSGSAGTPTSAPTTAPPASSLSPTSFTGPTG